jgi:3-phosphoshikimate 1-carboxyvinyltransferase
MAAYFSGATFTGTKRLKIKESDRAEAMRCELEKFGARVEISEDSVTVKGGDLHEPVELLSGHGDHRIVMSLATLASKLGGKILGAEAIKKSYPEFFEVFSLLGGEMEISEE